MIFNSLLPELYVTDFENSLHFYVDILNFKIEYQRENPRFAFLSYRGSQLMIQELILGEKEKEKLEYPLGRGINFQIETDNIQKIINSLNKDNHPLKRGIKDSWYRENNILHGCREILVMDPDGYLLRFSQSLGEKPAANQFMEYALGLNDRPFKAILAGTKKVEGRTPTKFDKTPFGKLNPGDLITFINNVSNETLKVRVAFIHHYPEVKEMLEKEGVQNVLSSEPKTVEHGVGSYNSIEGYEEGIKKNGIYAIGLELLQG